MSGNALTVTFAPNELPDGILTLTLGQTGEDLAGYIPKLTGDWNKQRQILPEAQAEAEY